MSGIFLDLPSVRFLRRFRFLQPMLRTIAASLFRWLSAPGCALRQVHFRHDEAEFPSALQGACNKFDSALYESRVADGVPRFFGALRPFNTWTELEDQHELLFIGKTLTPLARWERTQRKSRTLSEPPGTSENTEENTLATHCRIFRRRGREKEDHSRAAQWQPAFATCAKT